ncbi:MAG: PEP-CTERM sorting domain-containing protein [Candidatus Omnitrophica bacterium]|nr:PEP-CTERM sorting domain-containing protein [Candidatus Omnitrophota bacterium]
MKKVTLAVVMASLLLFTSDASAVVVDGINSAGEWVAGLLINGFDPNEGAIPDAYDISRVAMQSDAGALYVLIELYGVPTFTSLDILPPIDPVFYTTGLDTNADGDFTDLADRIFDFRASGFTVFDGSGTPVGGAPSAVLGSAVEYGIPSGMFASFPLGGFNTFSLLDNAGAPPDDRIPDAGFHTTIPEPTSMILFGSGLLGALGFARRKRNAA